MPNRLTNARGIGDFWGYWAKRHHPGFVSGEQCDFLASITYKWRGRSQIGSTVVRLERSGYNGGDVHFVESAPFVSETHHLTFSADFQSYSYGSADHALVIEGQSSKMGRYMIIVLPIRQPPSN
jgi:hypothetical protein